MTLNRLLRWAFALAHLVSLTQATSCVQVSNAYFAEECGCHSSTSFTFDVEGKVGLENNTVSLLQFGRQLAHKVSIRASAAPNLNSWSHTRVLGFTDTR